jgi:hypothetical protein
VGIRVIRGKNNSKNSCQFVAKNMSDIAIRVENLSKQYRIGARQAAYRTLREAMTDAAVAPFRRKRNPNSEFRNPNSEYIWALKDVSFEVQRGEVVGIPSTSSGQALAATGRGKRRLLRQAQYKAQDPLPHHRADRGLRRDPRAGGLPAGGLS